MSLPSLSPPAAGGSKQARGAERVGWTALAATSGDTADGTGTDLANPRSLHAGAVVERASHQMQTTDHCTRAELQSATLAERSLHSDAMKPAVRLPGLKLPFGSFPEPSLESYLSLRRATPPTLMPPIARVALPGPPPHARVK